MSITYSRIFVWWGQKQFVYQDATYDINNIHEILTVQESEDPSGRVGVFKGDLALELVKDHPAGLLTS